MCIGQDAGLVRPVFGIIAGMAAAVVNAHFVKVEWRDAFEARDIDAELIRI